MKIVNKKTIVSLLAVVALGAFSGLAISKGKPADKADKHTNQAEPQNNRAEPRNNQPKKEWYLRNTVTVYDGTTEQTYTGINAAILGKLVESSDGYDKHDITPYVSLANSKAAVLFIQNGWGDRSGEYHSDYHGSNRQSDSWVMTVVSTVAGGEITLNWDGLYALTSTKQDSGLVTYEEKRELDSQTLEKLHLIDLETLQVIEAVSVEDELNSYTFVMEADETSRQFRWVLGPINASYFAPASGSMQYIKSEQRKQARLKRNAGYETLTDDTFGLPPQ